MLQFSCLIESVETQNSRRPGEMGRRRDWTDPAI